MSERLTIRCVDNQHDLARLASTWTELAGGIPFRQWEWLESWWRHLGSVERRARLMVVVVENTAGEVVGIAPWFLSRSPAGRRVIRFLGCGAACSDYLSLLIRPTFELAVPEAIAAWLSTSAASAWDSIELSGVTREDPAVETLVRCLERQGLPAWSRQVIHCWRIDLPGSWDEYFQRLSKSRRDRAKSLIRKLFDSGRAVPRTVCNAADLATGQQILLDLHRRRRESLGDGGCFQSDRMIAFHAEVLERFAARGQLRMHWIELDGRPVAIEYSLCGSDSVYFYQSGIDPDAARDKPGWLNIIYSIKLAVEQGYRGFDFLRGDEAYKSSWRATPCPLVEIRVGARHIAGRGWFWVWRAREIAKRAIASTSKRAETAPSAVWQRHQPGLGKTPVAAAPVAGLAAGEADACEISEIVQESVGTL